jgi:hypothetical protein
MNHHIVSVLALVALPGCPFLDVEVEVPEVCITYSDVHVPGVTDESQIQSSFVIEDLSAIQALVDLDASVEFVRGEARITSGLDGFSFVEGARLTIASGAPDSTLPTLSLYECEGDCLANGTTLALPGGTQNAVIDYVKSGSLAIGIDLAGPPPATDWVMDVDICLKGRAGYTLEP